jgi:hypothetical protein
VKNIPTTVRGQMIIPFVLLNLLVGANAVSGQTVVTRQAGMVTPDKTFSIPRTDSRVKIDAVLDDPVWQTALVIDAHNEIQPGDNIPAPVNTRAYLAYSETDLYVAIQAFDTDPSQIRATFSDRDKIWNDDFAGIRIDTFNDSRSAFDFFSNPLGIQADQKVTSQNEDSSWDAIWESQGRITSDGYIVEMAIPFSSLKYQAGDGEKTWGFEIARIYPRSTRHTLTIFPWDRNNNNSLSNMGKLVGFSGMNAVKNLEIDPTSSMVLTQERADETSGKFIDRNHHPNFGFSSRWNVSPNMVLSTAVNPDFSNIEADDAQMDINTQFALSYSERRPFFIEGAELFRTNLWAVYTRTLADPSAGLKLTGKEGKNSVGFFSARDDITNILLPGSQGSDNTSLSMNSTGSVMRYRRDVGASSMLGILATNREGAGYYNRMGGVDGDLKFTPKDRLTFQFLGSQTEYPAAVLDEFDNQPGDAFGGSAFDVTYNHSTKSYGLWTQYRQVSPGFRADLGFMSQVGFRSTGISPSYTWNRDKGGWYSNISISSGFSHMEDFTGRMLGQSFGTSLNYNGPLQSYLYLNGEEVRQQYDGVTFEGADYCVYGSIRPTGSLFFDMGINAGDQIDYDNTRPGKRLRVSPSVEYKFGAHLIIGAGHSIERLNVRGGRLYTANVSNVRVEYQFGKRSFLRTNLQFVDYRFHSSLYKDEQDPESRRLGGQMLYSYKINARTVFYAGYSINTRGDQSIGLVQTDRTFFTKLGYAWMP